MNTILRRIVVISCGLILAGFGGVASAHPYEDEGALHGYMRTLREQSRIYRARIRAAAPGGEDRFVEEFRRRMNTRVERIIHRQLADPVSEADQLTEQRQDESLRRFEQMTELFISRYLQPGSAGQRRQSGNEADVDDLLQQVNAELVLHGGSAAPAGGETGIADLERWREGEYRLLDQRAAWEREVEAGYLRQLRGIKTEYRQIEARYGRQLADLQSRCEQEAAYRRERRQTYIADLNHEFEALREEVAGQTEDAGGLFDRLSCAYRQSQAMLAAAEMQLYLQGDSEYWSGIRARELERAEELQQAWAGLVQPGQSLPNLLLENQGELLQEEIAAARDETGRSEEIERKRSLMQRSADLRQILKQLQQAETYLAERCSADRSSEARMRAELHESLEWLIPEPAAEEYSQTSERLQRDAAQWAAELQQLYKDRSGDEFLKQCALALYHEEPSLLDPGYCTQNQNYRKLAEKLGSSPGDYLGSRAKRAYEKITDDARHQRMYRFYTMLVSRQPDPAMSYLSRAATEDLGQSLCAEITAHASRRAADLSAERDTFLKKAAVYSGLAAACYATFNFPGGAAMTALAATNAVRAADAKAKRDDVRALRRSLSEQKMSGREARSAIKGKLDAWDEGKSEIAAVRARVRRLEEAQHGDAFWRQQLSSGRGEFGFTRFFGDDTLGQEPLAAFLRRQEDRRPAGAAEKGSIKDYLRKMKAYARSESEALQAERDKCLRSTLNKLSAAVQLPSRRPVASSLLECEQCLQSLYGPGQADFYLSGAGNSGTAVRSLLQLAGAGRLENARRKGMLLEQRLVEKDELWQQGVELEIAEIRERRAAELDKLHDSGLRWDCEFRQTYLERQKLWEQRLNNYHMAETRWLKAAVGQRAEQVSAGGAEILQMEPESLSGRLTMVPLDSMNKWIPPAAAETEGPRRDLTALFSGPEEAAAESLLPELEQNRKRYAEYRAAVDRLYRDVEQQARRTALAAGIRSFSAALDGYQRELAAMIDSANVRASDSLHTSLRAAGYRRKGTVFQRNAIVDVTYFEHERELQSIGEYCDFQVPRLNWAARVRAAAESGGDAAAVERRYEQLVRAIGAQRDLIFGSYAADPDGVLQKTETDIRRRFAGAAQRFTDSAGYSDHKEMRGLFYWHVGYAPVMSEDDPEAVQRSGYGESGRILTAYYRNEACLGRGLSMTDQAGWDRRLWDDDINNDGKSDSWLQAATIRSLSDLGVKTAAGLSLGPVAAALAGLTDDALFAAADVAGGYKRWDEAAFGFGKQAVLQSATAAAGGVWGGLEVRPQWNGSAGLFTNLTPAVGRAAGRRLLSAGSAALEYHRDGGLDWNQERFGTAIWNTDAAVELGLAATGAVSSAVAHNRVLQKTHTYGFAHADIQAMRKGARFGGELLSGGIEYAATGRTTWNVLGVRGNGLLELQVDGDTAALALGRAGRSVSPVQLADLAQGAWLFGLQQRIAAASRDYADVGRESEVARMLRFQAGFGDAHSRDVLADILSGRVELRFPQTDAFRGRTSLNADRRREISISPAVHAGLDAPSMALTLQHEAHRDGCCLSGNEGETVEAVLAHTAMAAEISADPLYGSEFLYKDGSVLQDMAAIAAGESGVAALLESYCSDGDFWRINAAGDLLWDGSHHLWGQNGVLVQTHGPGSFSQDVADYMGISRDEALELMRKAGYKWNESRGTYEKRDAEFGLKARPALAAQYDLLRRFGEQTDGQLQPGTSAAYAWALREQAYRKELAEVSGRVSGGTRSSMAALDELLADRGSFEQAAGLDAAKHMESEGFGGITQSATLRRYSQQRLEAAVTGGALDAAAGNGYCLAESLAAHYVETFKEVDWEDIEQAFAGRHGWKDGFDPATGWVGDKQRFTAELSRRLGVNAVAREYRFDSREAMNRFLHAELSGKSDDYSFVADYGGHFTHVRPDGVELNTYDGWSSPKSGPHSWRVYAWDYAD